MKTFSAALVCVALVLASRVQADDLDDLLRNDSSVSAPQVAEEVSTRSDVSAADARGYADPHNLHSVIAASVAESQSSSAAPLVNQKVDETSGGISLVPEPSAVALAICALAYFLLFGRRRSVA
jgi:hypothetical protein